MKPWYIRCRQYIPWWAWPFVVAWGFAVAFCTFLSGCSVVGGLEELSSQNDWNNLPPPVPHHDKYDTVRADAPEALKTYYDPELTRKLNEN